jgi:hypothetical protein
MSEPRAILDCLYGCFPFHEIEAETIRVATLKLIIIQLMACVKFTTARTKKTDGPLSRKIMPKPNSLPTIRMHDDLRDESRKQFLSDLRKKAAFQKIPSRCLGYRAWKLPLCGGMAHCRGDLPRSSRRPTCATTRPPIPQLTTPTYLSRARVADHAPASRAWGS